MKVILAKNDDATLVGIWERRIGKDFDICPEIQLHSYKGTSYEDGLRRSNRCTILEAVREIIRKRREREPVFNRDSECTVSRGWKNKG